MNWQEMKKKAVDNGFVFLKHGSRHDIYVNKVNGKIIYYWNVIGRRKCAPA